MGKGPSLSLDKSERLGKKKKSERLENWYTHSRNNEYIAKRGKRLEKCYSQSEGPLMSVHNLPVFLDELSDLY